MHVAQINVARMLAPLDDASMAGFVAALDEVNAIADASPGFVWRLQTEEGNATFIRPFDDDLVLVNMSVWQSLDDLRAFVYHSAHSDILRCRLQWFERPSRAHVAVWWVPAGHIPTLEDGVRRLAYLQERGPSAAVFPLTQPFPAEA